MRREAKRPKMLDDVYDIIDGGERAAEMCKLDYSCVVVIDGRLGDERGMGDVNSDETI